MNDLIFAGHRCNDHSPSGGYDQVCSLFPDAGWLDGRALQAGRMEWQRRPQQGDGVTPRVIHVFYGDCSGKELPALLRQRFPGAAIVSSAHRPVARLESDEQARAALRASDAIITVSETQAHELRELALPAPIHPIPHGVWIDAFRPPTRSAGHHRKDVLIVGSFLRDWEGARWVIERLAQHDVRCIALGAGARGNLAGEGALVDVRERVSESELIALYEKSAAVFLPFLEATASNALLEAMVAGCPVVCPRLPSLVEEYLDDTSDSFEPGQYTAAADRLLHYVRDPSARVARSEQLMERVEVFDWSRLKPRYAAVFEQARTRAS